MSLSLCSLASVNSVSLKRFHISTWMTEIIGAIAKGKSEHYRGYQEKHSYGFALYK